MTECRQTYKTYVSTIDFPSSDSVPQCGTMCTNMRYGQYQHVVATLPDCGINRHEDVALVDKNLSNFGCVLANME